MRRFFFNHGTLDNINVKKSKNNFDVEPTRRTVDVKKEMHKICLISDNEIVPLDACSINYFQKDNMSAL